MRVTNTMIMNNSANNMNINKSNVDTLNNQMSSQKKISRPSDDPVIAIRALRLRSTLSEIDQYYEKNIPDAESWLDVTQTALKNMQEILTSIYKECNNGANDTLNQSDRNTILKNLNAMREQIYAEGNADYAGRTVFTGYKTNESLTFGTSDPAESYTITEKLNYDNVSQKSYYSGLSSVPTIDEINAGQAPTTNVEDHTYSRIRLAYDNLDNGNIELNYIDALGNVKPITSMPITYTDTDGATVTDTVTLITNRSYDDWQNAHDFQVGDNAILYIKETGELIFGKNVEAQINKDKPEMFITYDKTGFEKGELRPEHYFDCVKKTDPAEPITYTKEEQKISYTIAFNQTLDVNTEASDVFNSSIGRDIDELTDAVQMAISAHEKVDSIKSMMTEERYADQDSQELLQKWLDAAEKEAAYADDNMQNLYSKGITAFQGYLTDVTLALTDVGSKGNRLDMTKSRMSNQQITFEKLKSQNEDRDLSDIIIDYTAAYTAYQSSMQASAKAIKQTLLDYI